MKAVALPAVQRKNQGDSPLSDTSELSVCRLDCRDRHHIHALITTAAGPPARRLKSQSTRRSANSEAQSEPPGGQSPIFDVVSVPGTAEIGKSATEE